MKELDCGALSALAVELYRLRKLSVTSIQLVLRYPEHAIAQWVNMWKRKNISAAWLQGEFCYHEACGVIEDQKIRIWDPTENNWLMPPSSPIETFASVVALKITAPDNKHMKTVDWEGVPIQLGVWERLKFHAE